MDGNEKACFRLADSKARFIRFERDFYKKTREKLVCAP